LHTDSLAVIFQLPLHELYKHAFNDHFSVHVYKPALLTKVM